jgi:hypothetical protein
VLAAQRAHRLERVQPDAVVVAVRAARVGHGRLDDGAGVAVLREHRHVDREGLGVHELRRAGQRVQQVAVSQVLRGDVERDEHPGVAEQVPDREVRNGEDGGGVLDAHVDRAVGGELAAGVPRRERAGRDARADAVIGSDARRVERHVQRGGARQRQVVWFEHDDAE